MTMRHGTDTSTQSAFNGETITLSNTVIHEPAFKAFHCNIDGTVVVRYAGNQNEVSLVVKAGANYAYGIDQVLVTGTDVGMVLVGLRS